MTDTLTVPVLAGPASATGGWFGRVVDVVVGRLVEVVVGWLVEDDDEVLVEVDDVVGRLVDVDEDVLLDVLVDEVDELVEVVFFPPPRGCVVVEVEEVDVVVGRLVDVDDVVGRLVEVDVEVDDVEVVVGRLVELELLVDVDVEVEVVVGRLVELELLVDVDVEVEVVVGRLVELELLVDVVDDVVVVVWGLAAKVGTAETSASRTLPRTFPPRLTIYRLISCSCEFAGRVVVHGSKGCAEQVDAAPRKARTPIAPPPPPSPEPPGPQRLWAFTARTGYGQCDHRPIASIGNRDHSVRAP